MKRRCSIRMNEYSTCLERLGKTTTELKLDEDRDETGTWDRDIQYKCILKVPFKSIRRNLLLTVLQVCHWTLWSSG
jgi:hypothetical protein